MLFTVVIKKTKNNVYAEFVLSKTSDFTKRS